MKTTSELYQQGKELKWETVGKGIKRQLMGYDDKLLLVKIAFEKGAIGELHHHFHSQASFVHSGSFEVEIEGKKMILSSGDGFYIPPNSTHGVVCLEAGILIDSFSPIREDFF